MIEVLSYSHDLQEAPTCDAARHASGNSGGGTITVTKYVDRSSCQLIDFCNQAKNIPTAVLTIGKNDEGKVTRRLVYTLTNSVISSVSVGGSGGGKPQETVTFRYTAISWSGV